VRNGEREATSDVEKPPRIVHVTSAGTNAYNKNRRAQTTAKNDYVCEYYVLRDLEWCRGLARFTF
jgi:hypothetical protein